MTTVRERKRSAEAVMHGAIICESLEPGTVLEGFDLRITRWSRYEVGDTPEYQPSVWTLIEFEAPERETDALAQRLSKSLMLPGWYANWNTDAEAIVVFKDKIFRYKRGDASGRELAQQYGRDCGVPEPQLDWDD